MKKYIHISLLMILLLGTFRCKDHLDIPPASLTEEGFFANEAEFERAVFGVYQKLIFLYNYRGSNWIHDIWLLPSDDITTQGPYPFETFATLNATNGDVENLFRFLYQMIARANIVLLKQDERPSAYQDQTVKNAHKGEVLFLRGYANFLLWNHFETAPLVTERITDAEDAKVPNSTGTALLDQAIADFQEAAGLLPQVWAADHLGRVTSGAAHGMAGKALLYRATINKDNADYNASLAELNQVTGYSLLPVFGDNFDEAMEHNAESVFEIQFGKNNTNNVWLNNDAFSVVGDLGGYWGFFDGHWSMYGARNLESTESLRNTFEPGDPRISDTFDSASVKKYVNRPRSNGSPDNFNNARVLRYADVLLMKAEAINESGGSISEAMELVNMIRDRARMSDSIATVPAALSTDISDRAEVRQIIMDERRRELAFEEGNRWYDLRRWHKAGFINISSLDFGSVRGDFDFDESKHLVLPLPAGEIVLNPNLTQNSGY